MRAVKKTIATTMEITATGAGLTKVSVRTQESSLLADGADFPAVTSTTSKEAYQIYFSTDIGATVAAVIEYAEARNDPLIDLRVERPSLEDRFLEITTNGGSV